MTKPAFDVIWRLIADAEPVTKAAIFQDLRKHQVLHRLETEWGTQAEFILEAISRSQDITQRGVRGIIAELAFSEYILRPLSARLREIEIVGDQPYDALIADEIGQIRIQTKNQRLVLDPTSRRRVPLQPNAARVARYPSVAGWFVAETQKTRSGKAKFADKSASDGNSQSTRPYRFGEFDVLSVCLHPSTNDWTRFMFSPASTLLRRPSNHDQLEVLQPVPRTPCFAWTTSLMECISWVRDPATCPATFDEIPPTARVPRKVRAGKSRYTKQPK